LGIYAAQECLDLLNNGLDLRMNVEKHQPLESERIGVGDSVQTSNEQLHIDIHPLPLEINKHIPFLYHPAHQHKPLERV
jgi:hypothetical protein